jgi:hypothetical protein
MGHPDVFEALGSNATKSASTKAHATASCATLRISTVRFPSGAVAAPVVRVYLLKNIQALSARKTTVTIQRDESLIPVFLAMPRILMRYRLQRQIVIAENATVEIRPIIPDFHAPKSD